MHRITGLLFGPKTVKGHLVEGRQVALPSVTICMVILSRASVGKGISSAMIISNDCNLVTSFTIFLTGPSGPINYNNWDLILSVSTPLATDLIQAEKKFSRQISRSLSLPFEESGGHQSATKEFQFSNSLPSRQNGHFPRMKNCIL